MKSRKFSLTKRKIEVGTPKLIVLNRRGSIRRLRYLEVEDLISGVRVARNGKRMCFDAHLDHLKELWRG